MKRFTSSFASMVRTFYDPRSLKLGINLPRALQHVYISADDHQTACRCLLKLIFALDETINLQAPEILQACPWHALVDVTDPCLCVCLYV